ncbi:Nn.00g007160.m01.CDS01 [Neocucurbitaria sp. VM-36]
MKFRYDAFHAHMLTPFTDWGSFVTSTLDLAPTAIQAGRLLGVHASVFVFRFGQDDLSITCACRLEIEIYPEDIQA